MVIAPSAYADITYGLVGWWKLDEGSGVTANDSSGKYNAGTLVNGPTWGVGKRSGAVLCDGLDDLISIPSSTQYNSSGTWIFWIKTNGIWQTDGLSPSNSAVVMGRVDSDTSFNGANIIVNPSTGFVGIQIKDSGSMVFNNVGSMSVIDNQWHHVAVIFSRSNGGSVKLYIDSVLNMNGTTTGAWSFNNQAVNLCSSVDVYWEQFQGSLDDVRIYNRALSASEVKEIYDGKGHVVIGGRARLSGFHVK